MNLSFDTIIAGVNVVITLIVLYGSAKTRAEIAELKLYMHQNFVRIEDLRDPNYQLRHFSFPDKE